VPSDGYLQSQHCSVLTLPIVQPRLNSTLSWRITCKSYSLRCLFTTTAFCICHSQRHNRISPGERSTPGGWTLMRLASHGYDDIEQQTMPSLLADKDQILSLFPSLAQPTFLKTTVQCPRLRGSMVYGFFTMMAFIDVSLTSRLRCTTMGASRPRIHSHLFLRLYFSTIVMQMTT